VYGHQQPNVAVAVSAEELDRAVRVQHARVLDLQLDGKVETVLIRELQWDHLGKVMLHIDFERKSRSETVKVTVPIELRNAPKATGGAVLDQPLHKLHVECPLGSIPEAIRIDITNLTVEAPIHVRDLPLPEGVKVLDNPDLMVVHLKMPGAAETAAAAPAVAAAAEPEVIKKEKKEDEEGEEK
jgi:large subunit ribosomal protein L25